MRETYPAKSRYQSALAEENWKREDEIVERRTDYRREEGQVPAIYCLSPGRERLLEFMSERGAARP